MEVGVRADDFRELVEGRMTSEEYVRRLRERVARERPPKRRVRLSEIEDVELVAEREARERRERRRAFWRGFFGFFWPPLLPPGERHLFERWFRRG